MHLIQILVPLLRTDGEPQDPQLSRQTENELVERFTAVAAFSRAPGTYGQPAEATHMAICEVMTDALDQAWWSEYRVRLEARFNKPELVVRVSVIGT